MIQTTPSFESTQTLAVRSSGCTQVVCCWKGMPSTGGMSQHGESASSLVVGKLIQSRAGLIGAVEAVLGFNAADSGHIQQLCILLDLLFCHKNGPDVCFQVQVASTVRLWTCDGVCLVLQTCPGCQEPGVDLCNQGLGRGCRAYIACASRKIYKTFAMTGCSDGI